MNGSGPTAALLCSSSQSMCTNVCRRPIVKSLAFAVHPDWETGPSLHQSRCVTRAGTQCAASRPAAGFYEEAMRQRRDATSHGTFLLFSHRMATLQTALQTRQRRSHSWLLAPEAFRIKGKWAERQHQKLTTVTSSQHEIPEPTSHTKQPARPPPLRRPWP